jgi:heme-degrading monooxygenase HmoA
MAEGRDYLVVASHLPLARIGATPQFVRAVAAVRRQLAGTPGLLGYTLRAKPLAGDYWTLSVWSDDAALRAFMSAPPHAGVMASLKPVIGPARFAQWTTACADGRPRWEAALARLAE